MRPAREHDLLFHADSNGPSLLLGVHPDVEHVEFGIDDHAPAPFVYRVWLTPAGRARIKAAEPVFRRSDEADMAAAEQQSALRTIHELRAGAARPTRVRTPG